MSLTETTVLTLLRRHCGVLRRRLVFDVSREDGALITQQWMALLCLHVTREQLQDGLGYELRMAMDIVNTLCSCWGFSPVQNHRFWRTAVSELWIEYSDDPIDHRRSFCVEHLFQPPSHMMLPFGDAAFACYSIDFQEHAAAGYESLLVELWRQVTWTDAASTCPSWILTRRREVMDRLAGSGMVVRPIRTLQIELIVLANAVKAVIDSDESKLTQHDWAKLARCLHGLGASHNKLGHAPSPPLLARTSASIVSTGSSHELSIALHPDFKHCFYLHSSNLHAIRQLLCGCHFVRCLTLDVQIVREADPTDQVALFGELLRELLVEKKTLKVLRLLRWVTRHVIAAVCSVLPVATSLESLVISSSGSSDGEFAQQWCWLEYGLSHPLRRCGVFPELTLLVDETHLQDVATESRIEAAQRSETPLKPVVCDAVSAALSQSDSTRCSYLWYPVGMASALVVLESTGAWMQMTLHGSPVLFVAKEMALEAVAMVPELDVVGVIVRGCGLCWVSKHAVRIEIEHPVPVAGSGSTAVERSSRLFGLTAFAVRDRGDGSMQNVRYVRRSSSGMPILRWICGETIISLALAGFEYPYGPRLHDDDLELVLTLCPNLKTLCLEHYGVRDLQPLVDAYSSPSRPCQIMALSVAIAGIDTQCLPLLKMLSDPVHPGTRVLKQLSLTAMRMATQPSQFRSRDVVAMLTRNTVLERVYMCAPDNGSPQPQDWIDSSQKMFEVFQDQVLNDCRGVAIGLLSVVTYYSEGGVNSGPWKRTRRFTRHSSPGRLDEELIRHVLSFIGATRVRHMRWDCNQYRAFRGLTVARGWKYEYWL